MLVLVLVIFLLGITNICDADIPQITYAKLKDLLENSKHQREMFQVLQDSGGKYSAFVVTDILPDPDYYKNIEKFKVKAPKCIGNNLEFRQVKLPDGSLRTTYATEDGTFPSCLKAEMNVLSSTFDEIESMVSKLIMTLTGKALFFKDDPESEHLQPLESLPHKDHLHVYSRANKSKMSSWPDGGGRGKRRAALRSLDNKTPDDEDEPIMVPYHVDNGLFLIISSFHGHGMDIKSSTGKNFSTSMIDQNSVFVLFGQATREWLLQNEPEEIKDLFFATPHSVQSLKYSQLNFRSVYARMKVAQSNAVPHNDKSQNRGDLKLKKFSDTFFMSDKWHPGQVCSVDLDSKRDLWMEAMDSNCAHGSAYCWMSCYPLPKDCPLVEDARCFSSVTNVTCSTEPGGKPMDPTCKWECAPKKANFEPLLLNDYCNGKMDMLMFGFETSGRKNNPCVILFVEEWTLDNRLKFCIACVGVMALGVAIEALIAFRRLVSGRKGPFWRISCLARKLLLLVSFALNLVLGYLAMLVAMTYSIELFFSVIFGLILGHAIFNLNIAVSETIDPCCASQNSCKSTITKRFNEVIVVSERQDADSSSPCENLLSLESKEFHSSTKAFNGTASCTSGAQKSNHHSNCSDNGNNVIMQTNM